ncbi:fatty acid desaturase family protein [Paraburkholderia phosphatilytica]|uniref:fatty acid desaturase family protein n=1 Tax=Paraburkholderia phosphatilytica TaxID=2282883 RepID=UPI001F0C4401|nr:fatty acid desaturase [Paraburkholderia phosphatilytica]
MDPRPAPDLAQSHPTMRTARPAARAAKAADKADTRERPSVRLRRPPIDLRANVALVALVAGASLLQLFGLAALLHAYGAIMLLLIVPIVVLTPTHWGLIHEAIHSQLFASRRLNDVVARMLSVALAVPFDTVRFGHLMHHRFTREPYDQPDLYDGAGPLWRARLVYYVRLLGGLYAGELVVPLLAFMPARFASAQVAAAVGAKGPVGEQVQRLFVNFTADATRRGRTRRDWLMTIALYGAAFWFYGAWWPALAVAMLLRGMWISMADNLPHFDVELDEPGRARNFDVAPFWRVVVMNHHLHRLHHEQPTLPWTALPAYAAKLAAQQEADAERKATARAPMPYFRSALRQFCGPKRVGQVEGVPQRA